MPAVTIENGCGNKAGFPSAAGSFGAMAAAAAVCCTVKQTRIAADVAAAAVDAETVVAASSACWCFGSRPRSASTVAPAGRLSAPAAWTSAQSEGNWSRRGTASNLCLACCPAQKTLMV